jgi:hypothetical protein
MSNPDLSLFWQDEARSEVNAEPTAKDTEVVLEDRRGQVSIF